MECRDVKRVLVDNAGEPSPDVRRHLDECEPCAELARDDGLAQTLNRGSEGDTPIIDSKEMFLRLTAQVDAEDSALGWLKSRPTWARRGLAALSVVGAALFGVLFLRRPDLDAYPETRMMVSILLLALFLFVSLSFSLRPVHKSALPRVAVGGALVGGLLLSFVLAVTPSHYTPDPAFLPAGAEWLHALRCLYFGALVGLPVYVVSRLLDRSKDPSHALLAAGAAGLTGQLVLLLHCPISKPAHLVPGHASVAVLFLAIVWGIVLLERRLRR